MRVEMSYTDIVRAILRANPNGMTAQAIRDIVRLEYPDYYGTESHIRNVRSGNYKDIDHAVLARTYIACRSANDIVVDKTQKPFKMTVTSSAELVDMSLEESIDDESLEKLEADIGTLYILGTNLFTREGREIIKIGITTGPVEKRIQQLYTTGVPFRFRIISQFETTNYSKLEQALHSLFDPYRINKAREFFTDRCLQHIDKLIEIHLEIHRVP